MNTIVRTWIERVVAEPWKLYADRAEAEIDMVCDRTPDGKYVTDCGGWTWDPPCGGCDRCIADQTYYYTDRDRHQAVTYARAGFAFLPVVQIEWPGGGRTCDLPGALR